jgi:hypothetical protein
MARGSDNLTEQMNAVTTDHFHKGQIVSQVYDKNTLLDMLKERKHIIDGGLEVRKSLRLKEYGQATAIDPGDARTTPIVATRNYVNLEWKYFACPVGVTWDEEARNSGEHAIIDLVKDKRTEVTEDTNKLMSTQFYQTSRAGMDTNGFFTFVTTAATTYGGLSPSTYSEWEAGLYDITTTTLALFGTGSLDAGLRAVAFKNSPENTILVTTRAINSIYNAKLLPGERRTPEGGRAGKEFWTDSYFQTRPLMVDPQCNAGDILFIDLESLYLFVHPKHNFVFDAWQEDPDRYQASRSYMRIMCNWLCDMRKVFGAYTAITS